jgi:DNA-binding LytR/AlgR family response regulator
MAIRTIEAVFRTKHLFFLVFSPPNPYLCTIESVKLNKIRGLTDLVDDDWFGEVRKFPYLCTTFEAFYFSTQAMTSYLTFSNTNGLYRFPCDSIVYIAAEGNYSRFKMADGDDPLLVCQLGQLEEIMRTQLKEVENRFLRVGRSLIINLDYVYAINPSKGQLILSNGRGVRYPIPASKDALAALKNAYDNGLIK